MRDVVSPNEAWSGQLSRHLDSKSWELPAPLSLSPLPSPLSPLPAAGREVEIRLSWSFSPGEDRKRRRRELTRRLDRTTESRRHDSSRHRVVAVRTPRDERPDGDGAAPRHCVRASAAPGRDSAGPLGETDRRGNRTLAGQIGCRPPSSGDTQARRSVGHPCFLPVTCV